MCDIVYLKLYVSKNILHRTSIIGFLGLCSEPANKTLQRELKIFSRSTTIEKEVSHSSDPFLESNGSTLTFVLVFNNALQNNALQNNSRK